MRTTGTHNAHYSATEPVVFVAFELRENTWKLGCTIGHGQKPRERTGAARDPKRLLEEVAHAQARFGLPETAPVVSCYAAGRAGFWLHRFLQTQRYPPARRTRPSPHAGYGLGRTSTLALGGGPVYSGAVAWVASLLGGLAQHNLSRADSMRRPRSQKCPKEYETQGRRHRRTTDACKQQAASR